MAKTTNKNVTALVKTLQSIATFKEIDAPIIIKKLEVRPRQAKRSATYGVQIELIVNIARAINKPLSEDDKWSEIAELDAIEELSELLPVAKADRSEALEDLEIIRESYGYNAFIIEDENGIAESIHDGVEPDLIELEASYKNLLALFKLKDETDFKAPDASKWSKDEEKALAKCEALLAEADKDRQNLEAMQAD